MFVSYWLLIFPLILCVNQVISIPNDIALLKENFFANLIEETREISSQKLTDDIEREINLKIEGFLEVIGETPTESSRKRRETNDLLLNEKTNDIFILKGFTSQGFVPVNYPQDICLFKVDGKKFAAGLTYGKATNGTTGVNKLVIFLRENQAFREIYEYSSTYLTTIDCSEINGAGFVAVVNTIKQKDITRPDQILEIGSFIVRIKLESSGEPKAEVLQKIAQLNQNGVTLWSRSDDLYLVFSYNTFPTSPLAICVIYKLTGTSFAPIDDLPCQNSRFIEIFTVNHNLMVLIGNHRANNGTTNTFSKIMRYDLDQMRFIEHQSIETYAATVGRYFFIDHQNQRQHFLFIGNNFELNNEFDVINYDKPSMIYKYANGYFTPMQTISVSHVQSVLAIDGNGKFNLLIASEDRDVQIFYFDGWKFQESPIEFTGDSFGSGVVKMRAYDDIIPGTTTIVLANRDSFDPTFNVYTPIYAVKNDTSRLKSSISKWCNDAFERALAFDIDKAEKSLKATSELLNPENNHANFTGKVSLTNSTVITISAKEFKGRKVSFNSETALRFHQLSNRLSQLSTSAQHVSNKISFTKATQRMKRQAPPQMLVKTLIVDGPIKLESINGNPISDLVYKSIQRNPSLQDIIAKNIFVNQHLTLLGKVDGIEVAADNILLSQPEQVLRSVALEKVEATTVSGLSLVNSKHFGDFLTQLRRKVDRKIPNQIHRLKADSISIRRFLNERNFTALSINSLKTVGDQFMTGSTDIGKLRANSIVFQKDPQSHKISNISISELINIEDTRERIDIHQNIRFTQDLSTNRLFVTKRIKNLKVKNGQLQVLRKKGPARQVVTGEKFFDVVHLQSPILLQGKIESKTLQKMNPIASINENIVVQGDYKITGPVTIRRFVKSTEDIASSNPKLTLKNLIENGLSLRNSIVTKNNLVFQNIVEVRRNLNAISLNGKPVASFVKSNFDGLQIIKGVKTFKSSLGVHGGIVNADLINDVDVNLLNKTVLKRSSRAAQFIDGNVEMIALETPMFVSPNFNVNGKSSDLLLNVNKKQELNKITLPVGKVRSLKASQVHQSTEGKIFGNNLNKMIDDVVTKDSLAEGVYIADKTFTDLNVEHLTFSELNEWKSIVANYEQSIAQNLVYIGDRQFEKPMNVDSLHVTGTINDVTHYDMIYNWLQVEGDQTFTAPQEISSIETENNLVLMKETINEANIGQRIAESIWIDEPINIENLVFEKDIVVRGRIVAETVNDMKLNGNLILNNTNVLQTISKLEVADLDVSYINFTNLNGIDLVGLTKAFNPSDTSSSLNITGTARFNQLNVSHLNNEDLQQVIDVVWMADQNVVLTGEDIRFKTVDSQGPINSNFLNGRDLYEHYTDYFSLSKTQNILTFINVKGNIDILQGLETEKTILSGVIKTDLLNESDGLDLKNFANEVFRLDKPQTIKSNWSFKKIIIEGDYNGTINGLNFLNDVLHVGNLKTARFEGRKEFNTLHTDDIKTQFVNEIEIMPWIDNAVYLNKNEPQTISGQLLMAEADFYGDLQVDGTCNDVVINPQTVLIKSRDGQVINGDLTIVTMKDGKPRSSLIEKLDLTHGINGRNFDEAYANTFKQTDTAIDSKRIIFDDTLLASSVDINKNIYGVNVADFLKKSDESSELMEFQRNLKALESVGDSLRSSLDDVAVELNHFEYHQSLHGVNIQKTVPLKIQKGPTIEYVIAVHERDTNNSFEVIKFYRWDRELHSFVNDSTITPLQYNLASYQVSKLDKVVQKGIEHLFVEIFDKTLNKFLQNLMTYNEQSKTFINVGVNHQTTNSSLLFTLADGSSLCYGGIFPSFSDYHIICEDLDLPTVVMTNPIRMASSQDELVILLTEDHQLQIWNLQQLRQVLKVMNPQSHASVRFQGKYYIAVTSDKVEQSIHHGSIEIFESSDVVINFVHVQSFEMENPFMVQFSVIPSGDLMLYILTKNPGKALSIYQFAGASYFVENTGSSTIVNTGTHLSTITIDETTQFIAIISGEVFIIEVILNEY